MQVLAAEPVLVKHRHSGETLEVSRQERVENDHLYDTVHKAFVEPSAEEIHRAQLAAPFIRWCSADLFEELEEIERTGDFLDVNSNKVFNALFEGRISVLDPQSWASMQNTDSWETNTLEKAVRYARLYDKDIQSILVAIGNFKLMEVPMTVRLASGVLYLVGGNTRLMMCHGLGVFPKVLVAEGLFHSELAVRVARRFCKERG